MLFWRNNGVTSAKTKMWAHSKKGTFRHKCRVFGLENVFTLARNSFSSSVLANQLMLQDEFKCCQKSLIQNESQR